MKDASFNEEYSDISENVRHYNTHYLGVLTLSLFITGSLISLVSSTSSGFSGIHIMLLKIGGIILSFTFWINGEIYLYRQIRFECRLVELEDILGYKQYSMLLEFKKHRLPGRLRIGRWSWWLLHAVICSFWIVLLVI